jgi:dihydroorotate dehydrogenase (NAD+) catalytic subunit
MTVSLATTVGSVGLPNPVMAAAGTAGHGTELAPWVDFGRLGALVVKSLAAYEWPGNPAPRVHAAGAGMLNSVGLQGPGVDAWRRHELPHLQYAGARVVASIWGRTVDDYRMAAEQLRDAGGVVAVEVNVSCPNTEAGGEMFAHSPAATREVLAATEACGLPRWAKLSPNTDRLVEVAAAAVDGGAEALTLVNTLLGMVIDVDERRPALGAGGGGLSGPPLHPVAVRAVYEVHRALPSVPLVGVGGVSDAVTAVELLVAGASAVQVGTATFADPRATMRVLDDLERWCQRHGVADVGELTGAAHRS